MERTPKELEYENERDHIEFQLAIDELRKRIEYLQLQVTRLRLETRGK